MTWRGAWSSRWCRSSAATGRSWSSRWPRAGGALRTSAPRSEPPSFDPELAFDSSRGQYNSRILLAQLLREPRPGRPRGAHPRRSGVDLFIPVLTFVFGEAQLGDRAAVVSAYRLDNQLYGLPPSPDLLFERLVKEAVHELGHTYGLLHCHDDALRDGELDLRRADRPQGGALLRPLPRSPSRRPSGILGRGDGARRRRMTGCLRGPTGPDH